MKKSTIYVPYTTPRSKVEKIKYYGAEVIEIGMNYDEAHEFGLKATEDKGGIFIDPCSDKLVIAGQGTIALEILDEQPNIDVILVPIGGGGIITGISIAAKAINSNIKIIGLQTSSCPAMVESLKNEKLYEVYPTKPSICDALVDAVGYIPYKMAKKCIDDIIVVHEKDIADAVGFLLSKEKVVAEPAGAIGVAAVRKNPHLFEGKNIAVVITGGNIDEDLMLKIINQ